MKERYSEPQLEIITFSIADVINTSFAPTDDIAGAFDTQHGGISSGPNANAGEFGDEWL